MSQIETVRNPWNLSVLAELPIQTFEEVDAWLEEATRLHRSGPLPTAERTAILEKTADLLEGQLEAFALTIAREGGKPLSDARVEAERAVAGVRNAVMTLHTESGKEIPMQLNGSSANRWAFTVKEPIGPVVAISAFNHPLNLIVHQVVPAVATGCPVIVKPANNTPLSCLRFLELLREAGLPEAWGRAILLEREDAEKMVTDPRVAFFTFIGSSRVGWSLRSKLAPGTRCALEHGGAAPAILERDADLDKALPGLLKGGYYHAGQVCVSVQRIYVHEEILDDFLNRWIPAVEGLKTGDASDEATDCGPLIRPGEVDRVEEWVQEAIDKGGKLLTGGRRLGDTTYAPTVILDPPEDAKVSRSEIFGPVTVVYPFSDPDDAIQRANGLDVAFQSAIYSQNLDRALYYSHRLAAAAVMVNDHTAFRVDWMPFAGQRSSGLSTGGIPYTMEDMQQEKLIVLKSEAL